MSRATPLDAPCSGYGAKVRYWPAVWDRLEQTAPWDCTRFCFGFWLFRDRQHPKWPLPA